MIAGQNVGVIPPGDRTAGGGDAGVTYSVLDGDEILTVIYLQMVRICVYHTYADAGHMDM